MIINKKKANYIKDAPFLAKYNAKTMTVSFAEGYIFDCYESFLNNSASIKESLFFSQGSSFFKSNEEEVFTFQFNDWFYLDSEASIFKLTKDQRDNHSYMSNRFGVSFPKYLIWKAPPSAGVGGQQVISENIYLQDKSSGQKAGFKRTLLKKNADGSSNYRIEGGFVIVRDGHYQGFINGLDYVLKDGENQKEFGVKVELTADVAFGGSPDISPIFYIRNYEISSAELIEMPPSESFENEIASVDSPNGVYYFPIDFDTDEGNLYILFQCNYDYPILVGAESAQSLTLLGFGFAA